VQAREWLTGEGPVKENRDSEEARRYSELDRRSGAYGGNEEEGKLYKKFLNHSI
jgi:hypothetical protein